MKVHDSEAVVCFDVDDTLILHRPPCTEDTTIEISNPYLDGDTITVIVHKKHVKFLKEQYNRGRLVVVWSANGARWAHTVVKSLNLSKYVHIIITKPILCVDDTEAKYYMPKSLYIEE